MIFNCHLVRVCSRKVVVKAVTVKPVLTATSDHNNLLSIASLNLSEPNSMAIVFEKRLQSDLQWPLGQGPKGGCCRKVVVKAVTVKPVLTATSDHNNLLSMASLNISEPNYMAIVFEQPLQNNHRWPLD